MFPMQRPDPKLHALLEEEARRQHYDVEQGLRRHQQLLADGAPLPSWASDLPAPRPPRVLRRFGWLGTLVLGGMLYLGVVPAARVEPPRSAQPAPPLADAEPTVQPLRAPVVQQLPQTPQAPLAPSVAQAATTQAPVSPEARPVSAAPTPTFVHVSTHRDHALGSKPNTSSKSRGGLIAPSAPEPAESATSEVSTTRRPQASDPMAAEEMRQLSEAEHRLPAEPLQTLKLVRAGELEFKNGYFSEERRYLEIMALYALGRRDEASARATWFLRDYPAGAYRHKVQLARQMHAR